MTEKDEKQGLLPEARPARVAGRRPEKLQKVPEYEKLGMVRHYPEDKATDWSTKPRRGAQEAARSG